MREKFSFSEILEKTEEFQEAREWAQTHGAGSPEVFWEKCSNGNWLIKIASDAGVPRRTLMECALECVESALHLVSHENRLVEAVQTTRRWLQGEATKKEIRKANVLACAGARDVAISIPPSEFQTTSYVQLASAAAAVKVLTAAAVKDDPDNAIVLVVVVLAALGLQRPNADVVRKHIPFQMLSQYLR